MYPYLCFTCMAGLRKSVNAWILVLVWIFSTPRCRSHRLIQPFRRGMDHSTLYWLLPLLLIFFLLIMIAFGMILCARCREKRNSDTDGHCTCSAKRSKAREFFKDTIFYTTSSRHTENYYYRECATSCTCDPQKCKRCRVDVTRPASQKGILKSSTSGYEAIWADGVSF